MITRVVDYGGLFYDDLDARQRMLGRMIIAASGPPAGSRPAASGSSGCARSPSAHGLTMIQLACQWNLAHAAVHCVVPTLIQEAGPDARPVEDKRAELAALPAGSGSPMRTSMRSARSATTPAAWR